MGRLAAARDQLKSIFDGMDQGIVALDASYKVTLVSQKACAMLDRQEAELIGQGAAAVLGAAIAGPRGLLVEARETGLAETSSRLLGPSGMVKPVSVSIDKLDETVSEVAYETGYQDVRHFSTVFRQQTGLSPSQYRIQGGTKFI